MGTIAVGEVEVADDGSATVDLDTFAGLLYSAEIAASDAFTVANGGAVPPDAERVPLLRWYAQRSNSLAALLVPLLNDKTGNP